MVWPECHVDYAARADRHTLEEIRITFLCLVPKRCGAAKEQPHEFALAARIGLTENPFKMDPSCLYGDPECVCGLGEALVLDEAVRQSRFRGSQSKHCGQTF